MSTERQDQLDRNDSTCLGEIFLESLVKRHWDYALYRKCPSRFSGKTNVAYWCVEIESCNVHIDRISRDWKIGDSQQEITTVTRL